MHSSVREANLQALLSDDSELRTHIGDLVGVYENTRAEDVRGTRLAHMVDAVRLTQQEPGPNLIYDGTSLRVSSLPDSVLAPFVRFLTCKQQATGGSTSLDGLPGPTAIPREAKFLDKFSLRGVEYSTERCRTRNSHVLLQCFQSDASGAPNHPVPGQITHIFFHSNVPVPYSPPHDHNLLHPDFYLCVQPYVPLQPELSNIDQMYRKFGFAGGFVCRRELAPAIIIKPCDIISHVAVTPLDVKGHQVLHILPMDRVCPFLHTSRAKQLSADDLRTAHADTPHGR